MTSSARRALHILELINASSEPCRVTTVAERAQIVPGTAFRSLDALERCGFVERYRSSTQYQIGPATKRLQHALYAQFGIRQICMPFLRRLNFAHGETTSLVVPVGWHAVRITTLSGTRSVRASIRNGLIGLLDEDFAGRAILASYSKEEVDRFWAETANLRTGAPSRAALDEELERIRSLGFGTEADMNIAEHLAVALPIHVQGKAIACIAIDGPVFNPAEPADKQDSDWIAIRREIEEHVSRFPPDSFNPFSHMDPHEILAHML